MSAITVISVIICCLLIGAAALLITDAVRKLMRRKALSLPKSLLVIFGGGAACALLLVLFGSLVYYRAEPSAWTYIEGGENVTVSKEGNSYFFDGPGEDKALIFYPGALVEKEAYAQLTYELAENGIDTFLADMPLRFALLGINSADGIIASHSYDEWYMAGHSLGGSAASIYTAGTKNDINGLVLLASYPVDKLGDSVSGCLIYGDDDKVLSRERYENNRALFTGRITELCIEGGNHAQFGSYGAQLGDGAAEISPDEQKRITVEEIVKFVGIK